MSMNLVFITVPGNYMVEFPYQTSTNVTRAVLKATTIEDKLDILRKDIQSFSDGDTEWESDILFDIESSLRDETLDLIEI
jgi:hypothetical protein